MELGGGEDGRGGQDEVRWGLGMGWGEGVGECGMWAWGGVGRREAMDFQLEFNNFELKAGYVYQKSANSRFVVCMRSA